MARISELHYSNAYAKSSGVSEFLEVALDPSDDPADFTVSFYNSNGLVGDEITLSDPGVQVALDPETNEMIYVISADNFNLYLTDPDGGGSNNYEAFALTDTAAGTVIDFYDIGGGTQNILAQDGLAAGEQSENVGVLVGPEATTTTLQWNADAPDDVTYQELSFLDTGALVCFAQGTLIDTPAGPRTIETLRPGDLVLTQDKGPQPVRWIGKRTVRGRGTMAPILFKAGVLGAQVDLLVSPQHRMLIKGWRAEMMFGEREVLAPAHVLINDTTVRRAPGARVTYFHVLLDRHEVLTANGVLCESLLLSHRSASGWTAKAQDEVLNLFPELRISKAPWRTARPVPRSVPSRLLAPGSY